VTVTPELLAILVCPRCKGALDHDDRAHTLTCRACALRYPVRDNIPIMLVDEATPI